LPSCKFTQSHQFPDVTITECTDMLGAEETKLICMFAPATAGWCCWVHIVGRCVHLQQWHLWSSHFKIHYNQQQASRLPQILANWSVCQKIDLFIQHLLEFIRRVSPEELVVNEDRLGADRSKKVNEEASIGSTSARSIWRSINEEDWFWAEGLKEGICFLPIEEPNVSTKQSVSTTRVAKEESARLWRVPHRTS